MLGNFKVLQLGNGKVMIGTPSLLRASQKPIAASIYSTFRGNYFKQSIMSALSSATNIASVWVRKSLKVSPVS